MFLTSKRPKICVKKLLKKSYTRSNLSRTASKHTKCLVKHLKVPDQYKAQKMCDKAVESGYKPCN